MFLLQNEVTKSSLRLSDLRRGIIGELTKAGWEKRLRNSVYQCMQKFPPPPHPLAPAEHVKEPISYIRKAQVGAGWHAMQHKIINSILYIWECVVHVYGSIYAMNKQWLECVIKALVDSPRRLFI